MSIPAVFPPTTNLHHGEYQHGQGDNIDQYGTDGRKGLYIKSAEHDTASDPQEIADDYRNNLPGTDHLGSDDIPELSCKNSKKMATA